MKITILASVFLVFLVSCGSTPKEDFTMFRSRFFSDSVFQMGRIQFPLTGEYSGPEMAGRDSVNTAKTWTKDTWTALRLSGIDTAQYEHSVSVAESTAVEKLVGKGFGYYLECRFGRRQSQQWYLTYMKLENL